MNLRLCKLPVVEETILLRCKARFAHHSRILLIRAVSPCAHVVLVASTSIPAPVAAVVTTLVTAAVIFLITVVIFSLFPVLVRMLDRLKRVCVIERQWALHAIVPVWELLFVGVLSVLGLAVAIQKIILVLEARVVNYWRCIF